MRVEGVVVAAAAAIAGQGRGAAEEGIGLEVDLVGLVVVAAIAGEEEHRIGAVVHTVVVEVAVDHMVAGVAGVADHIEVERTGFAEDTAAAVVAQDKVDSGIDPEVVVPEAAVPDLHIRMAVVVVADSGREAVLEELVLLGDKDWPDQVAEDKVAVAFRCIAEVVANEVVGSDEDSS